MCNRSWVAALVLCATLSGAAGFFIGGMGDVKSPIRTAGQSDLAEGERRASDDRAEDEHKPRPSPHADKPERRGSEPRRDDAPQAPPTPAAGPATPFADLVIEPPPAGNGTATIIALDENDNPLPGVEVTLTVSYTDANPPPRSQSMRGLSPETAAMDAKRQYYDRMRLLKNRRVLVTGPDGRAAFRGLYGERYGLELWSSTHVVTTGYARAITSGEVVRVTLERGAHLEIALEWSGPASTQWRASFAQSSASPISEVFSAERGASLLVLPGAGGLKVESTDGAFRYTANLEVPDEGMKVLVRPWPTVLLSGRVRFEGARPARCSVKLLDPKSGASADNRVFGPMSRSEPAARVGADGKFEFRQLPPGEYTLGVDGNGKVLAQATVTVTEQPSEVELVVAPPDPAPSLSVTIRSDSPVDVERLNFTLHGKGKPVQYPVSPWVNTDGTVTLLIGAQVEWDQRGDCVLSVNSPDHGTAIVDVAAGQNSAVVTLARPCLVEVSVNGSEPDMVLSHDIVQLPSGNTIRHGWDMMGIGGGFILQPGDYEFRLTHAFYRCVVFRQSFTVSKRRERLSVTRPELYSVKCTTPSEARTRSYKLINIDLGLDAMIHPDQKNELNLRQLPAGTYTISITDRSQRGAEPRTVTFTLPGTTTLEIP
jgi:hypothetical protein